MSNASRIFKKKVKEFDDRIRKLESSKKGATAYRKGHINREKYDVQKQVDQALVALKEGQAYQDSLKKMIEEKKKQV